MSVPTSQRRLLNLLQLVRVVEAGSFAEAARRAGTSASAMSKAIMRFEQARGVKLLHRTTHAIALTQDGERLLDGARDLLKRLDDLDTMLDDASGGAAGRVRLAAPAAFIRSCIVPIMPAILKANPALELELKVDDVGLDLAAEGIDLAIRFGSLDRSPGMIAKRLATFPRILMATRRYVDYMGEPRSVEDLEAHHQIGHRDPATGQLLSWQFRHPASGEEVRTFSRRRLIVEDPSVASALVMRGIGTSWLPAWCVRNELRSGRVVELLRDWRVAELPIYAVQASRRHVPGRIHDLVKILSKGASDWQYDG